MCKILRVSVCELYTDDSLVVLVLVQRRHVMRDVTDVTWSMPQTVHNVEISQLLN